MIDDINIKLRQDIRTKLEWFYYELFKDLDQKYPDKHMIQLAVQDVVVESLDWNGLMLECLYEEL